MNNLNDVLAIYNEHFYGVGVTMQFKSKFPALGESPRQVFKAAKEEAKSGLEKLDALNLSDGDKQHLDQLKNGFKALIKACEAGADEKYVLMEIRAAKALFYVRQYMTKKKVKGVK